MIGLAWKCIELREAAELFSKLVPTMRGYFSKARCIIRFNVLLILMDGQQIDFGRKVHPDFLICFVREFL